VSCRRQNHSFDVFSEIFCQKSDETERNNFQPIFVAPFDENRRRKTCQNLPSKLKGFFVDAIEAPVREAGKFVTGKTFNVRGWLN
jgi:hypothetical protein